MSGLQVRRKPRHFSSSNIRYKKRTVRQSARITLYGKLAVDFFSCEKHLVSGVTLRISMRRSQDDFAVISEDPAKHYKVKIDEANLLIRKMTVSGNVVGAIEKTLLKTPAIYWYNEVIAKTFLAKTSQQSWKHEDIFTKGRPEESLSHYALVQHSSVPTSLIHSIIKKSVWER